MTTVAIVGGGFSGSLLALHVLRRCPQSTRVELFERGGQFGRGTAFSTGNPSHLLNVPAGRMSAFHDKPEDFAEWLTARPGLMEGDVAPGPGTFVPRRVFGAYVRDLLKNELRRPENAGRLYLVRGDVVNAEETGRGLTIHLDGGRNVYVDIAALAIGNFPPERPPGVSDGFVESGCYHSDPWNPRTLQDLHPNAGVLLIGTGLTTVDMIISLLDAGHRGPIHALSRRGLLPRPHAPQASGAPGANDAFPTRLVLLCQYLRETARDAELSGQGWQSVIDTVRPFTADIWQAFSPEDKDRFVRHARPWWDVHRHRMAPQVAARIQAALEQGRLQIHAGRIRWMGFEEGGVTVQFRRRGTRDIASLEVSRVINCAGPGCDYTRIPDPLVRNLLTNGLARPDVFQLGLDVTGNCALLNADGAISRRLFAVGPVTKGTFWEMVAVPDIRRQCEMLATYLNGLIKPGAASAAVLETVP